MCVNNSANKAGAYHVHTKTKIKIFFACGALKTQDAHMLDHPDPNRDWSLPLSIALALVSRSYACPREQ
jgi:hypothetical protein